MCIRDRLRGVEIAFQAAARPGAEVEAARAAGGVVALDDDVVGREFGRAALAAEDGDAAAGHHGLAAALGVRRGRWQLAATVAHFPATARTSALATIAVDRQALGLAGARALLARPAWRLHLGLAFAATRFGRATTATSGALMATADRATWSATVTPTVRIDRRLGRAAWLALDVGATALATVPAFEVRGPAGAAEVGRLWAVEPTVALSIAVTP